MMPLKSKTLTTYDEVLRSVHATWRLKETISKLLETLVLRFAEECSKFSGLIVLERAKCQTEIIEIVMVLELDNTSYSALVIRCALISLCVF